MSDINKRILPELPNQTDYQELEDSGLRGLSAKFYEGVPEGGTVETRDGEVEVTVYKPRTDEVVEMSDVTAQGYAAQVDAGLQITLTSTASALEFLRARDELAYLPRRDGEHGAWYSQDTSQGYLGLYSDGRLEYPVDTTQEFLGVKVWWDVYKIETDESTGEEVIKFKPVNGMWAETLRPDENSIGQAGYEALKTFIQREAEDNMIEVDGVRAGGDKACAGGFGFTMSQAKPLLDQIDVGDLTLDLTPGVTAIAGNVEGGSRRNAGIVRHNTDDYSVPIMAMIRRGYLKNATSIDAVSGFVTFSDAEEARKFVELISNEDRTGYIDTAIESLHFYMHGADTGTLTDDVYTTSEWGANSFEVLTNSLSEDQTALPQSHLFFPIIKKDGKLTILLSAEFYEDQSMVLDSFSLPTGYTLPSREEVQAFMISNDGRFISPKSDQFGQFPEKHVLGMDGRPRYQILNDDHMFKELPDGRWVYAMGSFYQPATDIEIIEYNEVGGFLEFSEWITYEEAQVMAELVNGATVISDYKYEMSMRRRDDLGFELNSEGEKTARYVIKYDYGVFLDAKEFLIARVAESKAAAAADPDSDSDSEIMVSLEPRMNVELTVGSAEQLIVALDKASRGMFESIYKWTSKFKDNNIFSAINVIAGTGAFVIGMGLGIPYLYKKSKWYRDIMNTQIREQAKAQAEGMQDRHNDQRLVNKTIDQYAPDLMTERAAEFPEQRVAGEHEVIGRTKEIRKILRYFYDRKRKNKKEQFGTFLAPGRTGKGDVIVGVADSLRLGVYPDGTPVEDFILEAFDEVRVLDFAGAVAGASYENEAEGYIKAILRYQKDHPKCLVIIDEAKDIATAGKSNIDPTSYLTRLFKTVERQSIMFTFATEDVDEFLSQIGKDPKQWMGRLSPIFGGWDSEKGGMKDLPGDHTALVLEKITYLSMNDYLVNDNIDLTVIDHALLEEIVKGAWTRWDFGCPGGAINDYDSFMSWLQEEAQKSPGNILQPNLEMYRRFVAENPSGRESQTAALGRKPLKFGVISDAEMKTVRERIIRTTSSIVTERESEEAAASIKTSYLARGEAYNTVANQPLPFRARQPQSDESSVEGPALTVVPSADVDEIIRAKLLEFIPDQKNIGAVMRDLTEIRRLSPDHFETLKNQLLEVGGVIEFTQFAQDFEATQKIVAENLRQERSQDQARSDLFADLESLDVPQTEESLGASQAEVDGESADSDNPSLAVEIDRQLRTALAYVNIPYDDDLKAKLLLIYERSEEEQRLSDTVYLARLNDFGTDIQGFSDGISSGSLSGNQIHERLSLIVSDHLSEVNHGDQSHPDAEAVSQALFGTVHESLDLFYQDKTLAEQKQGARSQYERLEQQLMQDDNGQYVIIQLNRMTASIITDTKLEYSELRSYRFKLRFLQKSTEMLSDPEKLALTEDQWNAEWQEFMNQNAGEFFKKKKGADRHAAQSEAGDSFSIVMDAVIKTSQDMAVQRRGRR